MIKKKNQKHVKGQYSIDRSSTNFG